MSKSFWTFSETLLWLLRIFKYYEHEICLIFQVELVCESADIGGTHWEAELAISKNINLSFLAKCLDFNGMTSFFSAIILLKAKITHPSIIFPDFPSHLQPMILYDEDDLRWWRSHGTVQLNLFEIKPLRWSILVRTCTEFSINLSFQHSTSSRNRQ